MDNKLDKIFKKKNNIIIGMVHFPPLLGYKDFPGIDLCLEKSLEDAKTLESGGVDGLIVENNYDIPHKVSVEKETIEIMINLTKAIIKEVSISVGVNVLWNDYKAAFTIAKECGCKFIRVPVFVDSVRTQCGEIIAEPEKVINYRKEKKANDIALLTDIHVKHAEMMENKTITESTKQAINKGSDALILTGEWTGDIPKINDLKEARKAAGKDLPILIGSGVNIDNVSNLLQYSNGVIIGTSLKTGKEYSREKEVNLKPWQEKIDLEKTKRFVDTVQNIA